MDFTTVIGSVAAFCTTISYFPQLKKCWETGSAGDLSLKMFSILASGVALWIVYGVLQKDMVIIVANAVSVCLLAGILYFKLRELRSPAGPVADANSRSARERQTESVYDTSARARRS